MAEDFSRNRQYEYKANSNLVLEADRDGLRRAKDEASGEVETMHGKTEKLRMGDRLVHEKIQPSAKAEHKPKSKRSHEEEAITGISKKKKHENKNILAGTEDLDSINYRPKTRETRIHYEELLSMIQASLGDQPQDILRGAADEILFILKDDRLRDPEKQREIEKILNRISSEAFAKYVSIAKAITDFNTGRDDQADQKEMDENVGVAVVFDDEEDDKDYQDSEDNSDEDDEVDSVDTSGGRGLRGADDDMEVDNADSAQLSAHDIDSHWLQRQLSKYYADANVSAKLADDILEVLKIPDGRTCENELVLLLDFDKFELIKLLLRNRSKIYYCTKLKQAQSDTERKDIEMEMMDDENDDGASILAELNQQTSAQNWTEERIGQFSKQVRKEARTLNKGVKVEVSSENVIESEAIIGGLDASQRSTGRERLLDLEDLQLLSKRASQAVELPEKSWRAQKKGYEEVHVPAIRPIISSSERLVNVNELPSWAQPTFLGIKTLNRIQSKMVDAAFKDSENILLCAPTGAGKTNVALLCMLQEISNHLNDDDSVKLNEFKIVYVAPMKALVQECVQSFGKKLAPLGISVKELSGDQNLSREQIQETQVIVTTPEKWDIITRKSGDRAYTQLVRLMIIDEIHLLHDDRGPVLESLVARTIRQIESTQEMVRLVGLSATLPNFEDVATFLRVKADKGLFFFDNSFRPVPLQQQYIGITEKKALKRFQVMNEICYEKVLAHAGKHQVLIFVHSRAETVKTAKALRDMALEHDTSAQFIREDSASKEILREESEGVKNVDLKDLLPYGFAIHHAGMVRSDRTLVEDLYSDKHIQVLVSTATLAWGVNLPAHTVILKGTQMYSPEEGKWVELSPLDVMQMMGRAGRYGLDSEGEGIIITQHSELQFYLSLMNQQLPIESQFFSKLPDMLNAEIVLGSIQTVKEAAIWLGYTYLHVRMLRNPAAYGMSWEFLKDDPALFQRRIDLAHSAAIVLDKHNLIKYDRKSGSCQVTALGRVASHYYVSHDSIHAFNEHMKPQMGEVEIFRLFALSGEFKNIHVREEEKIELMKLVTRVPIPVKESIDEPSAKVNVLLQSYISRLKLEGFALVSDMTYIQQSACRLMRAIHEIALKKNWASLAERTLTICKMVEKRTWSSQSPLRQFTGIPDVIVRKLEKNSDVTWDRYFDLQPQDLGEMVKLPKMGKALYKYIHMFPKIDLTASIYPITRSSLKIDLTLTPDFQYDVNVHDHALLFWIYVEDNDGENLLHSEPYIFRSQHSAVKRTVNFTVPLRDPMPPQYFVKVISDRWMHSETVLPISFRSLIPPQKFPPPSELLDLQPLPVSALSDPAMQAMFPFECFNPIQTQTYAACYENDENVLVFAPTGSGKTVCAELGLLRLFASNPDAKAVYIAAKQDIVDTMYDLWVQKFGQSLNHITIVKLVGDTTTDLALLERGNIICCSATQWDVLSRRWKQRKNVQKISMYVADELHLLGCDEGTTIEVCLSRARHITSQLNSDVRMIGLGASVANGKDFGDWLGVPEQFVYNFTPDVRSVPLDIFVHGFDAYHNGSRLLAMSKSVFNAIMGHAVSKPAIVFVPSSKQAQLTAIDIISYIAAAGKPTHFLNTSPDEMERVIKSMKDEALAQTLSNGVGFLHSGLTRSDREKVEGLFREGVISVMICVHDLCWSVKIVAHLVVIMDTVYFEGREHGFVDYRHSQIIQMIGLASRPEHDDNGVAVILCHTPKKQSLTHTLYAPLPIESHLDQHLHDHMNAEIVTKTVENKQDAVDYLTWTFYYRRLLQNPNFYNLSGLTHRHMSDHLSELIENVIADLEESKCVTVEDDMDVSPLNLGMISAYYYIQFKTVELFALSVTAKTKIKGLLEIITAAYEFGDLAIRLKEESLLRKIASHLPQALPAESNFEDPSTKALVLLQAHFSRLVLSSNLTQDLKWILKDSLKLIQAIVDVLSSQGWLRPALAAMELSQMIVQGLWDKDSPLKQIPHFSDALIEKCRGMNPAIESVFDVIELEDDTRNVLLHGMSPQQVSDVAMFCNAYPNVEVSFEKNFEDEVVAGDSYSVVVQLEKDIDDDDVGLNKVVSSRYSGNKLEGWWVIIGDSNANSLMAVKRLTLEKKARVKLDFIAPDDPGDYTLRLYLLSDSYLGCDQEYEISVSVVPDGDEDL